MSDLLLGIDIGTYSCKGVLVKPDGTLLKSHVVEYVMDIPHPGWAEQDADAVWWADVVTIWQNLLDGSPYSGDDVGGLAFSASGPCVLPINVSGNLLRSGILYGVDTRASSEIEQLNRKLGEVTIYNLSGMA
jgi:xylulokinase